MKRLVAILGGVFLVASCVSLDWSALGPHRSAPVVGAERVGSPECLVCHDEVHGHEKIAAYHADCESCHGGGSLHADSEDPLEIRHPANTDCLRCHAVGFDTHLSWGTGEHSRAGLYCTDCHNPHSTDRDHLRVFSQPGSRDMDVPSRLCIECHRDVSAEFNYPSHHPVREGGMACTSCHDPHEDSRVAHATTNQVCAECHQDIVGPWVYEHPPVAENCGSCHAPHGAVADNLLATIQPVVCLGCHPLNDQFHHDLFATGITDNIQITQDFPSAAGELLKANEVRAFLRRCTDCHGAIHGSYSDAKLRY